MWPWFNLFAEHILYASPSIHALLSICFNAFIVHGFLPSDLTDIVLVHTVKDNTGDISDKGNCIPIVLASVISKVFKMALLESSLKSIRIHLIIILGLNRNTLQIYVFIPWRRSLNFINHGLYQFMYVLWMRPRHSTGLTIGHSLTRAVLRLVWLSILLLLIERWRHLADSNEPNFINKTFLDLLKLIGSPGHHQHFTHC